MTAAARPDSLYLTIDSLPVSLTENWLFIRGDNPAMAAVNYKDSNWKSAKSTLPFADGDTTATQTCWLRKYIVINSTLVNMPIAVKVEQAGASEFYVDGKLIQAYGSIGRNSNYNPHGTPFIIVLPTAGPHVLAIRYANNRATFENKWLGKSAAGMYLSLNEANSTIVNLKRGLLVQSRLLLTLLGVFAALGIIHLLMFLYYREERSNLYFSSFCLSLTLCLTSVWMLLVDSNPAWYGIASLFSTVFVCLACLSMSGFINELFAKKRLRFYIICGLCATVIIIRFIDFFAGLVFMLVLIGIICLEAQILIIIALFRRVKGARIIGAGLFLVIFLLLFMLFTILFTGEFVMDEGSVLSAIFGVLFFIAVLSVPVSISAFLAWRFAALNKNLKQQLVQVQVLSAKTLEQEQEQKRLLETRQDELEKEVALRTAEVMKQHEELKVEKKKSDDLLLNILPAEVAEELKQSGAAKAKLYNEVSVLFTDFVNFTGISELLNPEELVAELDYCFRAFDDIITRHGMEKIKTIGDAYLAVSGLPVSNPEHALTAVNAAIDIREFIEKRKREKEATFSIRLGIHSGAVIAGIVGIKKFAYDIWGDTVNTAARMEQHGEAGKINISEATYTQVRDHIKCIYRGDLEAKNKGKMSMYFAG